MNVATKKIPLPDLSQLEFRRSWQQKDPGSWWSAGGLCVFNALGMKRISRLGLQLGLTDRPTKLLVVPDPDKTTLYMVPVSDHPMAVEIRYGKSSCSVVLAELFQYLGRSPLPGTREFHPVQFASEPVQIDTITATTLIMPLTATETRWAKSGNKKAAQAATQSRQSAAPAQD